jgi:hypothetical protein
VVDTGRVIGTVLEQDGGVVEGAKVEIRASDGKSYTTSTTANGTFALDVHHGPITWVISKAGYRTITGISSVSPMNTTELDLPDLPLVKEEERGPSTMLYLAAAIVICMIVVAAALVLRKREH